MVWTVSSVGTEKSVITRTLLFINNKSLFISPRQFLSQLDAATSQDPMQAEINHYN